ncbi:hypothetical protein BJX64DRAFT_257847 [Aspergillus heterothallicus]
MVSAKFYIDLLAASWTAQSAGPTSSRHEAQHSLWAIQKSQRQVSRSCRKSMGRIGVLDLPHWRDSNRRWDVSIS